MVMKNLKSGKVFLCLLAITLSFMLTAIANAQGNKKEVPERFSWWPTDSTPGPVKDEERGGYWWWPTTPGKVTPWGNRGYIYVAKIIFDYKGGELSSGNPNKPRPSLLIKKIIKNVKIYFDFDKAKLREEAAPILENAVKVLNKNPNGDILITGNTDIRGPETYNLKLGKRRAEAVREFMLSRGISEERIRILSRGKLDAVAPINDLVGMQKDRNAQFMIAEVEEVMAPYPGKTASVRKGAIEEVKEIETPIRVDTKEYTVQKGDTLWKIAAKEYGDGGQWKRIYNFNKDKIKGPDKLTPGAIIIIPVE